MLQLRFSSKKNLLTLVIFFVSLFVFVSPVSAVSDIEKKVTLEGFDTCYRWDLEKKMKQSEYRYYFNQSIGIHGLSLVTSDGESRSIPFITGKYYKDSGNCLDVMTGSVWNAAFTTVVQYPGLPGHLGVTPPTNDEVSASQQKLTNYMTQIGYNKTDVQDDSYLTECFALPYNEVMALPQERPIDMGQAYTSYMCLKHKEGSIYAVDAFTEPFKDSSKQFDAAWFEEPEYTSDQLIIRYRVKYCAVDGWDWTCLTDESIGLSMYLTDEGAFMSLTSLGYGTGVQAVADYFYAKASVAGGGSGAARVHALAPIYYPSSPEWNDGVQERGKIYAEYTMIGDERPVYGTGLLKDYPGYYSIAFTEDEKFELYTGYLKDYYGAGTDLICSTNSTVIVYYEARNTEWAKFGVTDNGGEKTCFAHKPIQNKKKKVHGLNEDNHFYNAEVGFDDIISALDGIKINAELKDENNGGAIPNPDDPNNPNNPNNPTPEEQQEQACYREAGSLGWVICPMIFGMNRFIDGIYRDKIEPLMQTHASVIEQLRDEDSALHNSWTIFRDIANILFVALFLVVIFSQITGVGIDNYGIKKTLPKLIVAAILVNLSFLLCALIVDATNLVGRSLYQMLTGMGDGITIMDGSQNLFTECPSGTCGVSGGVSFVTAIVEVLLVALTGAIAVLSVVNQGWLIILPILLLLLSAVISVFFLLVVLGLRQALIMLLIILAPVAVVLYALPNTGQTFKKYLNMFWQLLLVYPIASILIGAGYFGSRLLLATNTDSIAMYIVAGLISIVPYFFIPTLVANSMKAIGNIGNAIRGFGQRMSHQTQGMIDRGVRNAQFARDYQDRRMDRFQDRRMNRDLDADRRGSLLNRVAQRDANGNIMRHADGSVMLDNARLRRLSNSDKKRLMAAQNRMRDNGTMDARIVSGGHRISASSLAAQAAQYRAADTAQEVSDQEAQISDGSFEYTDSTGTVQRADSNSISSLQSALEAELGRSGTDVNTARIKALQNALSAKGDKGRSAVTNAMTNAQSAGTVSQVARQAYSENIAQKWSSDYKNNNRSTWNFAQDNASQTLAAGGSTTLADYQSGTRLNYDSLRANQMAEMDDDEFKRMLAQAQASAAAGDDTEMKTLQSLAAEALMDDSASIKSDRAKQLASIYGATVSTSGGTGSVTMGSTDVDAARQDLKIRNQLSILNVQHRGKINIGGTDYDVHRAPEGFTADDATVDGSGHVIYTRKDSTGAVVSRFDATDNKIIKP